MKHPPTNGPGNQALISGGVRCAIYTRKSTEEGLQQEFNTLDAQRESAEAYIKSQASEGWVCLPDRYDDGGFTGGNMERPALKRLMGEIEGRGVDCVVVYKVDRLSRSLLDFARMVDAFDRHKVSFVSVTQQINTATSSGRLMLNVLLSFAQFEREIISERTRDKIAAARRKGKWAGGHPLLGYDVVKSLSGSKLVVNEDEAKRVRQIFDLYREHQGLIPAVTEVNLRGWTTKRWITSKGKVRGGKSFDKCSLFLLLCNSIYMGKIRHKQQVYEGEHPAIVDQETFEEVRELLRENSRGGGVGGKESREVSGCKSGGDKHGGALLKGILRCKPCGCSMGPTYSSKGAVRYRYYVCLNAMKRGRGSCPSKSVPADQIEQFVVERVRAAVEDMDHGHVTDPQTSEAIQSLGPGWDRLPLKEQADVLQRLLERVEYDGHQGTVAITFRCDGISQPTEPEEQAA